MKTLVKQILLLGFVVFAFYAYTHWPRLREVTTGRTPEYPDLVAHDYGANVESVAKAVKKVMTDQPGWQIQGEAKGPVGIDIQAVHTHPLFRLKDDILVTVRREKGRTVVNVHGKSQMDAPDFGRNASTIHELLAALDHEVF